MTWEDRVKQASYTSPSKKKFVFDWEECEESFDHKSSIFRFPDKDGAEIQDLGIGEHRFPITAFINGDDYDINAQTFMDILAERGNGVLIHPIYGRKIVQPTNIKRLDNRVDAAGQGKISVLFIESKQIIAVETPEDSKDKIKKQQEDFDRETPEEFELQKKDDSAQDVANSEARFDRNLSAMDRLLGPIAELNDDVNAFFTSVSLSINNNITDLIGKPLILASQTVALIKTPARIVQSLGLRLSGYQDLAADLRSRASISSITNDSRNNLLETRFMLSACVAAMAETLGLETFRTKTEALTAAAILQDFHVLNRDFIEVEEAKFQTSSLDLLLYGDSQESKTLISIVEITANILASLSFDLKQERTIVLANDRTFIDLSFELYGNVEIETLDLLIDSNKLIDSEIILIPKGREIVYYV